MDRAALCNVSSSPKEKGKGKVRDENGVQFRPPFSRLEDFFLFFGQSSVDSSASAGRTQEAHSSSFCCVLFVWSVYLYLFSHVCTCTVLTGPSPLRHDSFLRLTCLVTSLVFDVQKVNRPKKKNPSTVTNFFLIRSLRRFVK
jgi:hypothetical protein